MISDKILKYWMLIFKIKTRLRIKLHWIYMQYLLNTGLYVMEAFEIKIFQIFTILMLILMIQSLFIFWTTILIKIKDTTFEVGFNNSIYLFS